LNVDLYRGLTSEAKELVGQHRRVVDRLPRTFLANTLMELEKWPTLFEPEKAYFRTLFAQLDAFDGTQFQDTFGSLKAFEQRAGCERVAANDPATYQRRLLDYLQGSGHYSAWRREIDGIFEKLQPLVEARLYAAEQKSRLVVILYEEGIALERDKLWQRFRSLGARVPLKIDGAEGRDAFVWALFTGARDAVSALGIRDSGFGIRERSAALPNPEPRIPNPDGEPRTPKPGAATLFEVLRDSKNFSPGDIWVLEAGDSLHRLCERADERRDEGLPPCATGLSYERLRSYRQRLSEAIYNRVLSGVRGPVELAEWIKTLQFTPQEGTTLYVDDRVLAFIRDVFLAGAGTLIINNTFVEWGAVQALKRAQPRLLVARFGVRDKMKPFSSLLLFSKPRAADQIPDLQDPLGSFVDVELLSYYIWLNAEEVAPYRGKTLYLLLADGVDEMLVVGPGPRRPVVRTEGPAPLTDVAATMAHWLGAELPGRSILQL
jgi:hypothetical protein